VPEADLTLLYNAACVFLFPSFYEGFGLGVLEAMACGCPVVVGRDTACDEVAAGAGLAVDPSDTRSIAEALVALLANPDLAARKRACALARAAAFTWRRTAEETFSIYRDAVAEARA